MNKLKDFEGFYLKTFSLEASFEIQDSVFRLEYRLKGPLDQLVIPAKGTACSMRDELWKHTCFEAFLQDKKSPAYWEFNFSPSRDWAIYRFERERQRVEVDITGIELVIQQERYPGELIMKIDIRPAEAFNVGRVGLTTVLEHQDESRSYWALTHTENKPDFHASESFIINL
ncbi:MAG: DOMON-like domain-containing protein [Proteobacteria bacterium]|nr:MAG: DOMON-like domain-containing protein [Pseudomonadota bacterium]